MIELIKHLLDYFVLLMTKNLFCLTYFLDYTKHLFNYTSFLFIF